MVNETAKKIGRNIKVIDNEDKLRNFANAYQEWKDKGYYPVEIAEIISAALDIGKTTYYKYLRLARQKGFITDTYEENMQISIEMRRRWLLLHGGKIKGIKFFYPSRTKKGNAESGTAEETKESCSWFKSIYKRIFK